MICKNCGKESNENYCPACGQKLATGRLTLPSMIHNIALGIFNCDQGILFTIKALFTRPGYMILEYLEGKRIRYFAPFQMLFILAAIHVLLYNMFGLEQVFEAAYKNLNGSNVLFWFLHFSQKYIAFLWLLLIPLTVVLYRWIYGNKFRKTFNWAETLFIGAYIQSQQAVIAIGSLLLYYVNKIFFPLTSPENHVLLTPFSSIGQNAVNIITILLTLIMAAWTFRQINGGSWLKNLFQVFIINLFVYLTYIIIITAVLVICITNSYMIF